ncbi:MAG TPA: nucleotidyltransferase family protein [Vicinamibacterales bacterium]|nr:nucleotidyltransferase family protein [Vicinamibacterales bacterium]
MPRLAAARTALLPAFQDTSSADLTRALAEGGAPLEALIISNQLAPLWHARTNVEAFRAARHHAALVYMRQRAALHEIDERFTQGGIRHAVIKGAAIRELIYDDPAVRACSDIDILVAPDQRFAAARILVDCGYRLHVDPSLASHEVTLSKRLIDIDLHWDILRPGRTRVPVIDGMLARRHNPAGMWMLSDVDSLFLMLVHAAVQKYVTANMGLHRVADIALWWQRRRVDWPRVHRDLETSGLKTGAWTVLSWVHCLAPASFALLIDEPTASVQPGAVKQAYLKSWLEHDLPTRFSKFHALRLLAFSTLMHDQWSGAWHGLDGWRRTRKLSSEDASVFNTLVD